jgi:hypothetical protein
MPLGLGAGFKLGSGDKEKEKDRDRDKDKDKDKDRDRDHDEQEHSEPLVEKRASKSEQRHGDDEPAPHTSGWTSILEDFFVHGLTVVGPSARTRDKSSHHELGRSLSTGDMGRRSKTGTKGPYEMLVKERLMGIYLAIFVHRDAKHLVRGVSYFFFSLIAGEVLKRWSLRHVQVCGHRRTHRGEGWQQGCRRD